MAKKINFRAWFKSKAADKVLSPVRKTLLEYIEPHSRVLEIGCGTGDLLFRASNKIAYGLGLDLDPAMIAFANNIKKKMELNNLDFCLQNAIELSLESGPKFDITTSTLCLHELNSDVAMKILTKMHECSRKILIADYCEPKTVSSKIGIEIDEFISGHYSQFRKYRAYGGIPYLAEKIDAPIVDQTLLDLDGICIWIIAGKYQFAS